MKGDNVVFAINPRTNYLIGEFQKYVKFMNDDDKNVLFAIFDGANDAMTIRKYISKRKISLSDSAEKILKKLKRLHLLTESNQINEAGSAVATILKLIPDL